MNTKIHDKELFDLKNQCLAERAINLIASENYSYQAVLDAQKFHLDFKYAEGYPGARYYKGCHVIDRIESLAIERVKKLFGVEYANVQPHSGSQANLAAFIAIMSPGDTFVACDLSSGGHLSHGHKAHISGKWFNAVHYTVDPKTHIIDMNQVEDVVKTHKPKMLICGFSAYSRFYDFEAFGEIAKRYGAILLADIAHVAGLVAGGQHPSPVGIADIITFTNHKTLRGPRSATILCNDRALAKKIDSALFPGLQGGPSPSNIAGRAAIYHIAQSDEFKQYTKQVVLNMQAAIAVLRANNIDMITGGSDNHLVLINLEKEKVLGSDFAQILEECNIISNANSIPFDKNSAFNPSGIRIGTAPCTSLGMLEQDFADIANIIVDILRNIQSGDKKSLSDSEVREYRARVENISNKFPFDKLYAL